MTTSQKPKATTLTATLSQADRFAEAARALGADEGEAAFKAKLAVIAKQKPAIPPESKKTAPRKERPLP